jgi:two-component system, OmpR family, response regulator RegX3
VRGRILLVDDDPGILDVVSYSLRREGYEVATADDGVKALAVAAGQQLDLVILDLMLPDISGEDVCGRLRTLGNTVPVLMLSAKDAELDKVLGLELGADDYVTKPFSTAELLSRVRAIFRRREYEQSESANGTKRVGDLVFDLTRHQVAVAGREVRLTPSEFRVLALLATKPGYVFTRRQIMEHLWETEHVGDEHAGEVHVSNLRRKIEDDPSRPSRIVTVRSAGYKLMAS